MNAVNLTPLERFTKDIAMLLEKYYRDSMSERIKKGIALKKLKKASTNG